MLHALGVLLLWIMLPTAAVNIKGATGGVNTATGQRPSRQNLVTFQGSGAAFDLFILALQKFQQENQANIVSLYKIDGRDERRHTWNVHR